MLVIVVDFKIHPGDVAAFRAAIEANAAASVRDEPGCRQFDVAEAPDDPTVIFLYEVYDDAAAFDAHLASPHYREFDRLSAPWIAEKVVRKLRLVGANNDF